MPYALSASARELADFAIRRLQDAGPGFTQPVLAGNIVYGDQDKIPDTPYICVEPNEKNRLETGGGMQKVYRVEMDLYIYVYHSKVQSVTTQRRDADVLSEEIEDTLHLDNHCDGLVIDSYVSKNESGTSNKNNSLIRANRITFHTISRQQLPQAI
jgi:hypothetical protein